jgi:hypothetical protein
MAVFQFNYNSNHKVFTALLFIGWAVWHFSGSSDQPRRYENGQDKITGSKVEGRNHGYWVWYHPNGKKKMEGTFHYGKRVGTWKTFDQAENLRTESNYHDDKLHGDYFRWDEKGNLIEHQMYDNDVLIPSESEKPDNKNTNE